MFFHDTMQVDETLDIQGRQAIKTFPRLRKTPDSPPYTAHSVAREQTIEEGQSYDKIKLLHESQKPLMHLMPELYLEYIGELIPMTISAGW